MRVFGLGTASKHWFLAVPVTHSLETRPHSFIALPGPHGEVIRLGRSPLLAGHLVCSVHHLAPDEEVRDDRDINVVGDLTQ